MLPYVPRFTSSIACSIVSTWIRPSTGQKFPSARPGHGAKSPRMVGRTKKPCHIPGCAVGDHRRERGAPSCAPCPMSDSTRSLLCAVMTGPSQCPHPIHCLPFGSQPHPPWPGKCRRASPTVRTRDAARQRCPAQPKALSATILVVISMSASGNTTTGFLAPPWHWARLPFAVARL